MEEILQKSDDIVDTILATSGAFKILNQRE